MKLYDQLDDLPQSRQEKVKLSIDELFRGRLPGARTKFQKDDEFNDFFLFNDIRDGHTAIHSWDIIKTTTREKNICRLLLKNRRKSIYGAFDGNPLAERHFKGLDASITKSELEQLVRKGILKQIFYTYKVKDFKSNGRDANELLLLQHAKNRRLMLEDLKKSRELKKTSFSPILDRLASEGVIEPEEARYDFRYTKISSGIEGICHIYLPVSDVFSTLVASDTNDYVATRNIYATSLREYRQKFISEIFEPKNYRKITKKEACAIQGFPNDFKLPERRTEWMKLIGNSVSIPVIRAIADSIVKTGVFGDTAIESIRPHTTIRSGIKTVAIDI